MAYVEPRHSAHDAVEIVLRNGARTAAIAAYAAALAVAVALLAPVLFGDGQEAVELPAEPQPVYYTVKPGESLPAVASRHGLSLERFFALNRDLAPFAGEPRMRVVVGWR